MKISLISGALVFFAVVLVGAPAPVFAYGEGVPVPVIVIPAFHSSGQTAPHVSSGSSGGKVLGASAYEFTNKLSRGSRGQDVSELQKLLISLGYLKSGYVTGYFGPLTEAGVKKFQIAHGFEAVGYVGPKTLIALNSGTTPIAANNNQPRVVKWIQSQANTVSEKIQNVLALSAQL